MSLAGGPPAPDPREIGAILDRAMAEVEQKIAQQRQVLKLIASEDAAAPAECPLLACPRLDRLRAAVMDAIEVLDETRRSFKSRQLEALRKRLGEALR